MSLDRLRAASHFSDAALSRRVRFRRDDVQHILIVLQIRHRGEAYR